MRMLSLETLLRDSRLSDRLTEEARRRVLDRARMLEGEGYELEGADGTLELLIREALHPEARLFEVVNCEIRTRIAPGFHAQSTAAVTLLVEGHARTTTLSANGPVEALDLCLRQCLFQLYPAVTDVHLADYQCCVLDPERGSAAKVQVRVKWADGHDKWTTMGVSGNVLEASWLALLNGVRLELMRLGDQDEAVLAAHEDYSWGV